MPNADANVLFDICLCVKINSVEIIPEKDEHCRAGNFILLEKGNQATSIN